MRRASLHILSRDRGEALANFLGSLLHQTYLPHFDIVILDNSRGVKVRQHYLCAVLLERLKFEGVRVHIVETPDETRDIGHYRNLCIENDPFNNEIGIRIDDDSLLDPKYIEIIMNGFRDENIGIVGGICPYMQYPKIHILQPAKFNEVTDSFDWVDHCCNFVRIINDDGTDREWWKTYYPSGHIRSNYGYRIKLAKKIRFPEWTGPSGFVEETVFCIKMWMNNYKVLINPNAIAWHFAYPAGGGRDKIVSQQQMDEIKRNNIERLKTELDLYRKSLNIEAKGYP